VRLLDAGSAAAAAAGWDGAGLPAAANNHRNAEKNVNSFPNCNAHRAPPISVSVALRSDTSLHCKTTDTGSDGFRARPGRPRPNHSVDRPNHWKLRSTLGGSNIPFPFLLAYSWPTLLSAAPGYGASASRGVPAHAPAMASTHCTHPRRDGQAELPR